MNPPMHYAVSKQHGQYIITNGSIKKRPVWPFVFIRILRMLSADSMHWFWSMFHAGFIYMHACSKYVSRNMHGFSMRAACLLHACKNLVLDFAFPKCSNIESNTREVRVTSDIEKFKSNTCDVYSIIFQHASSKSCHVTCMLRACHLLVAPVTCDRFTLTRIQHDFCQHCSMHVVSACTTHDHNIRHVQINMHVTCTGFCLGFMFQIHIYFWP